MTVFDALLLAVVGVSIFFASVRGAVRELATLLVLGLSALLAWIGATPVAAALGKDSFIASAAVAGVIGIAAFVGGYFLLHKAMLRLKFDKRMRSADRVGGGVFGLVRALALIGLGFLGYGYYLDEANQPDSVRRAWLLPVASSAAGFFEQFAPANRELRAAEKKNANAAREGYDGADRSGLREIVTTATTTEAGTKAPDPIADILAEEKAGDAEPQRR
jgi:uncharacterized membrane protein required for colicin V production